MASPSSLVDPVNILSTATTTLCELVCPMCSFELGSGGLCPGPKNVLFKFVANLLDKIVRAPKQLYKKKRCDVK